MGFEVIEPGFMCTIQDSGRTGYRRYGMPVSGPMDEFAFKAANLLVGNPGNTAALEIGSGGLILMSRGNTLLSVCGVNPTLNIERRVESTWQVIEAEDRETIHIKTGPRGAWVYLAAAGGFRVDPVMGSAATYIRARIGGLHGDRLSEGDFLEVNPQDPSQGAKVGDYFPEIDRLGYTNTPEIRVVIYDEYEKTFPESLEVFYQTGFMVDLNSDRMGYRLILDGKELISGGEIVSEAVCPGTIQVPPSGHPVVMMADSPTTGGYMKLGCVARVDMPLLAQLLPGSGKIRFIPIKVNEAQVLYRKHIQKLDTAIVKIKDENLVGWAGALD